MGSRIAVLALIVLAAGLATAPARRGSFIYDDHYYVVENPAVSGDASPWTEPLGEAGQALWRPLTVATWRWQWALSGPDPAPFLVLNILLHALVSVLVWRVAMAWGLAPVAGVLAGLLFATHPVHAEAVGWVSGRSELLATAFVLAAWLAYEGRSRGGALTAAALFGLGAMSKENALIAPALFLVADLLRPDRSPRWGRLALLAVVGAGIWGLRSQVLGQALPGDAPYGDLPLGDRLVVAANVLAGSVRLLTWPHPLRIHYHRDEFVLFQPATVAVLGAVIVMAWLLRRRAEGLAALTLLPLALVPVLNLVPIGETFAERFLYLPSVFFCLTVAVALDALGRRELYGRGPGLSIALGLGALLLAVPVCRAATLVLRDDLSLWAHAARVAPWDPHARYNHGYHLDAAGRYLTEDREEPGSRDELAASLRLEPQHRYAAFTHHMLGNYALGAVGGFTPDMERAAWHYRQAVEREPGLFDARINLASIALRAPQVVSSAEAQASLANVLSQPHLTVERRLAAEELLDRLADGEADGS